MRAPALFLVLLLSTAAFSQQKWSGDILKDAPVKPKVEKPPKTPKLKKRNAPRPSWRHKGKTFHSDNPLFHHKEVKNPK